MVKKYNIYENTEYKFVKFSDILTDIRENFLDELESFDKLPVKTWKRFLKHSTLLEVLLSYVHVDPYKTNAILISNDTSFDSCGLLDDDKVMQHIFKTVNQCKRKIPLLIKNIDCDFEELEDFLSTGEGVEFIMQLDSDKEKLRNNACSFKEFKIFARDNALTYILDEIVDKNEFKRLFIS